MSSESKPKVKLNNKLILGWCIINADFMLYALCKKSALIMHQPNTKLRLTQLAFNSKIWTYIL
jgi:hypothetical protein